MENINLLPNDEAMDFTLDSIYDGKVEAFNLLSLRGKPIMMFFYPVDFGYVSPTEFYQLESIMDKFKTLDCEILAISTEHIPSIIKFLDAEKSIAGLGGNMKIRLVSDPVGKVSKSYGIYKNDENISFKAIILLDPNLKMISCEKFDFPVGCNFEEIFIKLQESLANGEVPSCSTCEVTGFVHGRTYNEN